ncbi:hypothetical protein ACIGPN_28925 [Streptomyces afghaniensis]|uniref:hypothetical protein n=1 Tax=Streptomyces TaxID=1883 RepID=UPI001FAF56F2|nr:hypothetical protein [Streptomyces sp. HP-A2021]UOB15396.1 hypothetical protein MQE23_43050 [Streptomyces sp. HP-A2021]
MAFETALMALGLPQPLLHRAGTAARRLMCRLRLVALPVQLGQVLLMPAQLRLSVLRPLGRGRVFLLPQLLSRFQVQGAGKPGIPARREHRCGRGLRLGVRGPP